MATTHNLGFPRIGGQRELKFALEDYWGGRQTEQELAITQPICAGVTGSNRPGSITCR